MTQTRICFPPDGLATFRTFLKSEFSDENIEFWLTCEDYKKITSSYKMSSKARKIFEQFVEAESPKEVEDTPYNTLTLVILYIIMCIIEVSVVLQYAFS